VPVSGLNAQRQALKQEEAVAGRRTLCVAIDETGNEDFKSEAALFGIAGVMGFGLQMSRAEGQWRRMKALHFGGADKPMHASGRKFSCNQIKAISGFFERSRLARLLT
jgi:hypothetical protein